MAVDFAAQSLVFADTQPRKIEVPIKSNAGKPSGEAHLEVPEGWKVDPPMQHFELAGTGAQTAVAFELTPPAANAKGTVRAVAMVGGHSISVGTEVISYPHFPAQTLFPAAQAALVRADIKNLAKNIGYVMGAGDEVPGSLRQIGCDVTLLTAEDLSHGDLSRYDAIVTGVRAWNTRADLRANYQRLYDYASNGGTVIVREVPDGPSAKAGPAGVVAAERKEQRASAQAPTRNFSPRRVKPQPRPRFRLCEVRWTRTNGPRWSIWVRIPPATIA